MKLVVFVDVQNDFIDGSLGVDTDHKIADRILAYARSCKSQGVLTVATRDTHDSTYPTTLEGKNLPIDHCMMGTSGRDLYCDLYSLVDKTFDKSTFMSEDLGTFVKKLTRDENLDMTIDEVELCGYCTSICVISNALYLRGLLPNAKISILSNLCGDSDEQLHAAALKIANRSQIDVKVGTL